MRNVHTYENPFSPKETRLKYAQKNHIVYVQSVTNNFIVPLDDNVRIADDDILVTVNREELEIFEEWAYERGMMEKLERKERPSGLYQPEQDLASDFIPLPTEDPSVKRIERHEEVGMIPVTFTSSSKEITVLIASSATVDQVTRFLHERLNMPISDYFP